MFYRYPELHCKPYQQLRTLTQLTAGLSLTMFAAYFYPARFFRCHPRWGFLALTLCVVLAHAVLLMRSPLSMIALTASDSVAIPTFSTRFVAAPPIVSKPASMRDSVAAKVPAKVRKQQTVVANALAPTEDAAKQTLDSASATDSVPTEKENAQTSAQAASQDTSADALSTSTAPEPSTPSHTHLAADYAIPASARMVYDVNGVVGGVSYTGSAELVWQHDGKTYDARLAIRKFLVPLRVQTSKGNITTHGLEPVRFGDRRGSEVAAHFERDANKVVFSANTPDAALLPGGQDQLSVFIQLGAMFGADAQRYKPGSTLTFQAVGGHYSEQWSFVVGGWEDKTLSGMQLRAVELTRYPTGEYDPQVQVWLASSIGYLPSHIRLSQKNGDFVDMSLESMRTQ